jgi:hypothetical protein
MATIFGEREKDLNSIFTGMKKLADGKEIREPSAPIKLACEDLTKLFQQVIQRLEKEGDEMIGFCLSPEEIEKAFEETSLSCGKVNLLRNAFFYITEAIRFGKNGDSFDFDKTAQNLEFLLEKSRKKNSLKAPCKLLALQIFKHFQITQGSDWQPDFVLKSFLELEKILDDPDFSLEPHADPNPNIPGHILGEFHEENNRFALSFLK